MQKIIGIRRSGDKNIYYFTATEEYKSGDKVLFNGIIYESLIDNNVWSPEAYSAGWVKF